jgi:hypothetical protein
VSDLQGRYGSDSVHDEPELAATPDDTGPPRKGLTVGDLVRAALDQPISGLKMSALAAAQLSIRKHGLGASSTGVDFSKLVLVAPRLTISQELVGDWRAKLLDAQPGISVLVATDMSRSIAAIKVAGFAGLAGIDATKTKSRPLWRIGGRATEHDHQARGRSGSWASTFLRPLVDQAERTKVEQ